MNMSDKLKSKSKWGKLLSKSDKNENQFKLNEDVVDFLKPSTEKYPGEGTRQLAGPRIDVAVAQRWPDASDTRRAPEAASGGRKASRSKNLAVRFVRTPPEIIGEGGDEAETPVNDVSRAKASLARSKTERRPGLDTKLAEAHRHTKSQPMSAPGGEAPQPPKHRHHHSLADSSHPSQHRFFEPPFDRLDSVQDEQDVPRPGIKRTPTAFSSVDEEEEDDDADSPAGQVEYDMPVIVAPDPPVSPPISANPELARFLADSPPHPRSLSEPVQARQNQLRAEEGRVLRRLSRLDYDDSVDPRRPPSPNSPPRKSPSHGHLFVEPIPLVIPDHEPSSSERPLPFATPSDVPVHPLPTLPLIPPITTHDFDDPHNENEPQRHSPPDMQPSLRQMPSAASLQPQQTLHPMQSSSSLSPQQPLRQTHSTASLQPQQPLRHMSSTPSFQPQSSGQHHPLPPTPNRGPSQGYFQSQPSNPNGLTPSPVDPYGRSGSVSSQHRAVSAPDAGVDSSEHVACSDFGARVAHMKGVFRLTAERERPTQSVTPRQWLRAAIWWLHKGRAGLTARIKNAPRDHNGQRAELLTQAHVDVAKTWWILTDIIGGPDSPQSRVDSPQDTLKRDTDIARASLRSFTLSMSRNNVMPPYQSLIQGQDTTMWLEYPRFASDVASLLRGNTSNALLVDQDQEEVNPLDALPLGDSRNTFCYSRMFVNASVNTEEADSDRVVLPCILTMMRGRSDHQVKVVISSQMDLVNLVIKPGDGGFGKGPTWNDVSWKTRFHGIYIRLPRGFALNVEFQEGDFRALWSMIEYTNKISASMKPEPDERLIHEARLVELKHSDSSNPHAFPKDPVRACTAFVFEKRLVFHNAAGDTKIHRGYRLLLVTNPVNKTLSMASLSLGKGSPLLFETSDGPPMLTFYTQDAKRQCRSSLVFKGADERQDIYNVLQGITMTPDENVTARLALRNMVIETSKGTESIAGAFRGLRWRDVRIVSDSTDNGGKDQGDKILSEHFRIIAIHDGGGVTDRLNLGPGELLFRITANNTPAISLLRAPQEDLTISVDVRKTQNPEAISALVSTAQKTPTTRTLTFSSLPDLHVFQKAITGYTVRYDHPCSLFAISRRRMVVPIYKKWEAAKVRLQILTSGNITKIAAFFDEFVHADAMVFQIKSTDTFERVKGDKPTRYGVKFVDAKFSLAGKEKGDKGDGEEREGGAEGEWGRSVKRRFVNLEGLEYAGEHDDITVGFETEEDRDRFCEGLPAALTTKSMINLKRRI